MTDPNLFRLRCAYVKQGRLALLSHLEIARALERAVRRAGLPFAVSQGFSPHMRIAFGSALPVGVGSTCEVFDVLLTRYVPPEQALLVLQAASVPDLMVQGCSYVEPAAPAASVAFPQATYEVCFAQPISGFQVPTTITVERKRKTKTLVVDDYLCGPLQVEGCTVRFTLMARESGSLRPDVLVRECSFGQQPSSITRVAQTS